MAVPVGFLWLRRNHHITVPMEDRMATTHTTTSNLTVKIVPNDKAHHEGRLVLSRPMPRPRNELTSWSPLSIAIRMSR